MHITPTNMLPDRVDAIMRELAELRAAVAGFQHGDENLPDDGNDLTEASLLDTHAAQESVVILEFAFSSKSPKAFDMGVLRQNWNRWREASEIAS